MELPLSAIEYNRFATSHKRFYLMYLALAALIIFYELVSDGKMVEQIDSWWALLRFFASHWAFLVKAYFFAMASADRRAMKWYQDREVERIAHLEDGERQTQHAAAEKRANERERNSLIRAELAKFPYAKENGLEVAFKVLAPEIKTNEEGELVGPNDEPMAGYISAQLNCEYDYMLAAKRPRGVTGGKGRAQEIREVKPGVGPQGIGHNDRELPRQPIGSESANGRKPKIETDESQTEDDPAQGRATGGN